MDKIDKLSDAIRLGATFRIQAYRSGLEHASCALEAAAEAIGWDKAAWGQLNTRWPDLTNLRICCPHAGCHIYRQLMEIGYHLNDAHHWTREAIADWFASKGM